MLVPPGFRTERCVRYRYSYSECSRCADVCPHGAVQLHNAGIEIDASRCQGCGLCAAVCATEALTEKSVSAEHLLKIAGSKRQLIISCAPSGVRSDAVVPCLGAINPVVLAELSHRGIAIQLAGTAYCAQCAHFPQGSDLLRLNLDTRNVLCRIEGDEHWAALAIQDSTPTKNLPEKGGHDAGRRGLFRRFVGYSADAMSDRAAVPPAPLKAIRAAAPCLPERKVILNNLYATCGDEQVKLPRHSAIPAEDLLVTQGCTHCEACVRVCPTGALQLLENNSVWRIAFLSERCVACDVCAEVCQPKALRQRADDIVVSKRKARLLYEVPKQRCASCDRVFVSVDGAHICPVCQRDDEDFEHLFG